MKPLGRSRRVAVMAVAAAVVGGVILLWNRRTVVEYPAQKAFWVDQVDSIQSLAFSPDGKRLAFATASATASWETDFPKVEQSRNGSTDVYSVSFRSYRGGMKGGVYVLNLTEGRAVAGGVVLKGWANALVFTPDGRTLLVAEGDVGGNQQGYGIRFELEPVASGPGRLVLLDTKTWRSRTIDFPGPVLSVAISPDGKTAAALALTASRTPRTEVTLWDLADGAKTGELALNGMVLVPALAGPLRLLAFSPDGTKLAVVDQRKVKTDDYFIWDAAKGESIYRPKSEPPGDVVIWDVAKKTVVHRIRQSAAAAGFSPDGRHLVVSGEGTSVYDTDTWTSSYAIDRRDDCGLRLMEPLCNEHRLFLATGDWFRGVRGRIVQLLNGEVQSTGLLVSPFHHDTPNRHRAETLAVAVSPDRQLIAAGGRGFEICVWAMPDFPQCKHERGEAKNGP